jgi:hypothetical protein
VFCIPPLYDPNWNTQLLPGTLLDRRIRPNSKDFKENLLPYAIADILCAHIAKIMKVLAMLNNTQHFIPVGSICMPRSLLMYLKTK